MPEFKPTIAIVLDKRTRLKSGLYPVSLRATFQVHEGEKKSWLRRYYKTGHTLSQDVFDRVMSRPRTEEQTQIRADLMGIESKAVGIVKNNVVITPDLFERLFSGASGYTVGAFFDRHIAELQEFSQVSTASSYKTAIGSLKTFAGGDFTFMEVTPDFLRRYDKWMKTRVVTKKIGKKEVIASRGASVTTVAIYLRCLRAVFNNAIAAKAVSADLYPFGKRQFSIQTVENHKQALSVEQKDRVLSIEGNKAVDFWVFSYLCNGMNFSDICRLRVGDIHDGAIYLSRTKTINTSRVRKKIEIPLRAEVEAIIARYGNKSLNPFDYVFPVLREGLTPLQERYKIQRFTDDTNVALRKVASDLGFAFKFTTYTARHTFASVAEQNGATKSFIQHALGHASIRTTEVYTAGFERGAKKVVSEGL